MKPGTMVAFILNAQIQFGILAAVIRRESLEGETKKYVVTSVGADGTANHDQTIDDEDDVVDMDSWNKDSRLLDLARRTVSYKWAEKKARELDEPVAPPSPAREAGKEEGLDATAELGQHAAGDPAEPRNAADVPL